MLYTSLDLLIAEIIGVTAAFFTYHLLAHRNKKGWIFYLISSIVLVYIMWHKESWITFLNQSMMGVLCIKNYFLFNSPRNKISTYLDWMAFVVFVFSLSFIEKLDGKFLSEVGLWLVIVTKTIFLGQQKLKGWYWQILQQLISIIFGLYTGIYIYVFKSIVQLFQGVYGYFKWKNTKNS